MISDDFTKRQHARGKIVPLFLCLVFAGSAAAAATSPIQISSPQESSTVRGAVRIVVEPQSTDVLWVNVFVDDEYLASSPPYTFIWDSTRYSKGDHSITATAYSAQGAYLGTATTGVRVSNRAVSVLVPATGSIVSGTVNVVTKVVDDADWINLSVDGLYVSSPDYNFALDTTSFGGRSAPDHRQCLAKSSQLRGWRFNRVRHCQQQFDASVGCGWLRVVLYL